MRLMCILLAVLLTVIVSGVTGLVCVVLVSGFTTGGAAWLGWALSMVLFVNAVVCLNVVFDALLG